MRKERCASAAFATVYRISHRFIMSVESSKNKKNKNLLVRNQLLYSQAINQARNERA